MAKHTSLLALSRSDLRERWANRPEEVGLPSGLPPLDRATAGGLPLGHVTTIVGGSGAGKSELARQFARAISKKHAVIHVDVELGPDELTTRDLAQASLLPPAIVRKRLLTRAELDAISRAQENLESEFYQLIHPTDLVPLSDLDMAIQAAALAMDRQYTCVILDSIQRLADFAPRETNRERVEYLMRWMERFAHRTGYAVLTTSEAKHNAAGVEPTPEEMKTAAAESRAIEYVSHVLVGIVPGEKLTSREAGDASAEWEKKAKLLIAKNRRGPEGYLPGVLRFKAPCWQMEFEATKRDVAPLKLQWAVSRLEGEAVYSTNDLRVEWKCSAEQARAIRDALLLRGALERDANGTYKKSTAEVDFA